MSANCIDQYCPQNCCNKLGYCINRYSFSYSENTCYYYYNTNTNNSFPYTYAIPIIVIGTIIIIVFIVVMCRRWRRRAEPHGMPYLQGGPAVPGQPTIDTDNRLDQPQFMGNQLVYNELQGNNFQGQTANQGPYNYPQPYQNRINNQDNGWKAQGYSSPVMYPPAYPDLNNGNGQNY